MPVKWDNEARYTLLLMILSQTPSALSSKVDADAISKSWPKAGELTPRAIQEQIRLFRRDIRDIQAGKAPVTPSSSSRSTSTSMFSTPRKVSTPTLAAAGVTPTRRANGTAAQSVTPAAKKRKVIRRTKKNAAVDDSDTPEQALTSEEEGPAVETDEDQDDLPLSNHPTTIQRRTLPARSKRRSQSYAQPSDSEEEAGGKNGSEVDSDFSLSGMQMGDEAKIKARRALGTASGDSVTGDGVIREGAGSKEGVLDVNMGRDGDGESDAESRSTRRTSWNSALEEI